MTRAAPAKLLGLKDRGHLGTGAIADIAVYRKDKKISKMFGAAALVFKNGDLVVKDGAVTHYRPGKTLRLQPPADKAMVKRMDAYYQEKYGLRARRLRLPRPCHFRRTEFRGGRMRPMKVNGVVIDDTFAEAFGMKATAIIITGPNRKWARQAAISMTGFATSVIACGCEAAIDAELPASATPDGRPGVRVMLFAMSTDELQKQLQTRVGQCVLTCPGSACFAGLTAPQRT